MGAGKSGYLARAYFDIWLLALPIPFKLDKPRIQLHTNTSYDAPQINIRISTGFNNTNTYEPGIMAFLRYARCCNRESRRTMTSQHAHPQQVSRALLPGKFIQIQKHIILLIHLDLKYSEDLFNYTRGRFVCNEKHEMSQRHVRFDVNELARCAADAVGAKTCVSVAKYPDGMYNKSMLLTMDDGSQVVAKVPNPNAGLPHYTTASEVATMDFVSSSSYLVKLCPHVVD